ncbi:MAG: hypothetical protein ABSG92_11035 [Conexivisphaerales archaeon]|jgi:hypothetical protein
MAGSAVILVLVNVFIKSWDLWAAIVALLVPWTALTVMQVFYLSTAIRRAPSQQGSESWGTQGQQEGSFEGGWLRKPRRSFAALRQSKC